MFGGINKTRSNELYFYDPEQEMWIYITPKGMRLPPERSYHAVWIDENYNKMFVYAGQSSKRHSL